MELNEILNIYIDLENRVNDLWRSLWPRSKEK